MSQARSGNFFTPQSVHMYFQRAEDMLKLKNMDDAVAAYSLAIQVYNGLSKDQKKSADSRLLIVVATCHLRLAIFSHQENQQRLCPGILGLIMRHSEAGLDIIERVGTRKVEESSKLNDQLKECHKSASSSYLRLLDVMTRVDEKRSMVEKKKFPDFKPDKWTIAPPSPKTVTATSRDTNLSKGVEQASIKVETVIRSPINLAEDQAQFKPISDKKQSLPAIAKVVCAFFTLLHHVSDPILNPHDLNKEARKKMHKPKL